MPITQQQIEQLVQEREQEGLYLEFKAGAGMRNTDEFKRELVKDCTAFSNGGGGKIIYGIAEGDVDGVACAAGWSPVDAAWFTRDWISEVLASNTMPPLSRFEVVELPQAGGCRVVVVEVEQSSTCHQNLKDRRYYQRIGATAQPMVDFQIRDVMARKAAPELRVEVEMRNELRTAELHRYRLVATVHNVGQVTLDRWVCEIDVPDFIVRDTRSPVQTLMRANPMFGQLVQSVHGSVCQVERLTFGEPGLGNVQRTLHPGQRLVFDGTGPFQAEVIAEVDGETWRRLSALTPDARAVGDLHWRVYLKDAAPIQGVVPLHLWCAF